ncbi:MAG: DUF4105 domain-containing protein [Candidatus Nomurabacteria bacterium]|nr:DUF4105 domain-containing protein [Candidatus Nomurabacteria bacterium]
MQIKKFFKIKYLFFVFLIVSAIFIAIKPTNTADWALDQQILPSAKISNNFVTIDNVRNFSYTSVSDYTPSYYTKTYNLNKIKSVDYIVEPFGEFGGAAHTFLSFGFEGGEYVAVSVEIRKKKGQSFSPWKGLLKQYTLVYVVADEKDVVKLRTNYRKDDVYVYPTKIDQLHAKQLFLSMIQRVNKLQNEPEFYNTITNTCTTNIVRHVNEISEIKVPISYKVLMPGYSDKLAYDLGLLDTNLPYEKIRERYKINDKAMKYADDVNFSIRIRE